VPVPVLCIQVTVGGVRDKAEWDGLGRRLPQRSALAKDAFEKVDGVEQWRVPG
jgi:hypothetical protein